MCSFSLCFINFAERSFQLKDVLSDIFIKVCPRHKNSPVQLPVKDGETGFHILGGGLWPFLFAHCIIVLP